MSVFSDEVFLHGKKKYQGLDAHQWREVAASDAFCQHPLWEPTSMDHCSSIKTSNLMKGTLGSAHNCMCFRLNVSKLPTTGKLHNYK